jgi:hypothetical protein
MRKNSIETKGGIGFQERAHSGDAIIPLTGAHSRQPAKYVLCVILNYICSLGPQMNIPTACIQILDQLAHMVNTIHEADFVKPSEALSRSTIGQHLRHTLEFFICFEQGFQNGVINYDKRSHDKLIETDKYIALSVIAKISDFVTNVQTNKPLKLEVGYDHRQEEYVTVETNATRELVYNIEHAVHHMAIMKIGIREVAPYILVPADFGVAASTVRYKDAATPSHHH